jgi:hypothetical protein
MIRRFTEGAERDSDESGVLAGSVSPEPLGDVRRRRPARASDLIAEFEMPRDARPRNNFKDPLLQFRRKLPRHNVFVMCDGRHGYRRGTLRTAARAPGPNPNPTESEPNRTELNRTELNRTEPN